MSHSHYGTDCLHGHCNGSINCGQRLFSPNRSVELVMQEDGNLVLYRRKDLHPLWASNTNGSGAQVAVMQGDGNFVLYAPGGRPVWASNTNGKHNCRVALQNDGNLVVYDGHNHAVWASNTNNQCDDCQDSLHSGEKLLPGRSIHSKNGKVDLVMQTDGNLVLYRTADNHPIWASNTNGRAVRECIMQHDGNLVIYDVHGTAIWASNTCGQHGAGLKLQDDGNLCMYKSGNCCWASGTFGKCN